GARGLVAVVAVGDEERRGELERLRGQPPEAGAHPALVDLEHRLAARPRRRRVAVVEEEDRLELRPRRAEEREPAGLRLLVRALVREHLAGGVRRGLEGARDPLARALDAVRAGVGLLEPPERGRLLAQ